MQEVLERLLRVFGHVVHLVQDDELESLLEKVVGLDELVDLVPDDVDPAFVGSVQMQHVGFVHAVVPALVLVDEVHDGGGFARARRAVEEQVGENLLGHHILEKAAVAVLQYDFAKRGRAVLLDPHIHYGAGRRAGEGSYANYCALCSLCSRCPVYVAFAADT